MALRMSKHGRQLLGSREFLFYPNTQLYAELKSMSHEALGHVIFAYSLRAKLQCGELSPSPIDLISLVLLVHSSPALLLRCLMCAIARTLLRATVI